MTTTGTTDSEQYGGPAAMGVASAQVSDAIGPGEGNDAAIVDAAIRSVTATAHVVPTSELAAEAEAAGRRPRRSYGLAARGLFRLLDSIYGKPASLEKFRVLEVVARVPYQAWEQVAFVAITHTHEDPRFARRVHDRVTAARSQQDNEFFHLLMLEELLDRDGYERSLFRGRLLPQAIALVYYHFSWLLYAARPRFSHALNADFEDHAMHTYLEYVATNPAFETTVWESDFRNEYGPYDTLADLFRSIALDERQHRDESEDLIEDARFGAEDHRSSEPTKGPRSRASSRPAMPESAIPRP